jgi:fibronectin-binding autotransporter adhesin
MKSLYILLCLRCSVSVVSAAVISWDGSTSGDWTAGSNWVGNVAPVAGDDLFFGTPAAGGTKVMNNNFPTGTDFASIQFFSGSYTLAGNLIDLTTGGITSGVLNGNATINAPLRIRSVNQAFDAPGAAATLTYGGSISTNALQLTFQGDGTHIVNDNITGSGSVLKREAGTLRLFGVNTPSGGTTVDNGILDLRGSLGAGDVVVALVGTLVGDGTVTSNVAVVGQLAPGVGSTLGDLTINGNLTFAGSGSRIAVFDAGEAGAVDSDSLVVGGNVTLAGANFTLNVQSGFIPTVGKILTLINKTSAGAISGTFGGIAQDSESVIGGIRFHFSYTGGNGNDFTATVVPSLSTGITRTWSGAGATNKWSNAANWTGGVIPQSGDSLVFPTGLALDRRDADNDIGSQIVSLHNIFVNQGSYVITGQPLALTGDFTVDAITGSIQWDPPLQVFGSAAILTNGALLELNGALSLSPANLELGCRSTSNGRIQVDGGIVGTGNVTTSSSVGAGTVDFAGAVPNTYSGVTTVLSGTLLLNHAAAIPHTLVVQSGEVVVNTAATIPDTAAVTLNAGAVLTLNQNETIGPLTLTGGRVETNAFSLNISGLLSARFGDRVGGSVNQSNHLRGNIIMSASTPSVVIGPEPEAALWIIGTFSGTTGLVSAGKSGPGDLVLDLQTAATPLVVLCSEGAITLFGTAPANNSIIILSGASLEGSGTTGSFSVPSGVVTPSFFNRNPFDSAGVINCSSLNLSSSSTLELQLGMTSGNQILQDALSVTGNVSLGSSILNIIDAGSRAIPEGTIVTLLTNGGTDAIDGTFLGRAEGSRVITRSNHFIISYIGGTGNDITLTAVRPTAGPTVTWDGEGDLLPGLCWCDGISWQGNVAPVPGSSLVFPDSVPNVPYNRTALFGFERGIKMNSISLTGGGYLFDFPGYGADDFFLMRGLTDNHTGAANRFVDMVSMDAGQDFKVLGTGALQLEGGVDTNGFLLTTEVTQTALAPRLSIGQIIGGGTLVKQGAGGIEFIGSTDNDTGTIEWIAGELRLSKTAGINAMGAGKTLLIGFANGPIPAKVTMTNANQLPDNTLVDIRENGRWEVSQPETIGTLVSLGGELNLTSVLTIAGAAPNFFASVILPAGTTTFRITGNGTVARNSFFLWEVAAGTTVDVATGITLQPAAGQSAGFAGPGRTRLQGSYNLPNGIAVGVNSSVAARRLALVRMDGSSPNTPILLQGGTLQGIGSLGEIRGSSLGGRIHPDDLGNVGDELVASGLRLNVGGTSTLLDLDIGLFSEGLGEPESDSIQTSGIVELGNALPRLRFKTGYSPVAGDAFLIISKTSPGPVTLPFLGLPEGSTFVAGAARFSITYVGGTGNDIVLTSLGAPDFKITSLTLGAASGGPGSPGKSVTFTAIGLPGAMHQLAASDDLTDWTVIADVRADENGILSATANDPAATGPKRFYRLQY